MASRELLDQVLQKLPEHRLREVLDFARFLTSQEEHEAWREFGRSQLARAYGEDEPDYGPEDVKPELQS